MPAGFSDNYGLTLEALDDHPSNYPTRYNANLLLLDAHSHAFTDLTGITGTPDGTKFLRDDGSWQTVVGGGGGTANDSLAVGGITVTGTPTNGQVLRATSSSTASWSAGAAGDLISTNNLSDLNDAPTARTNLGLGTVSVFDTADVLQPGNNLSEILSATTARSNLGLSAMATMDPAAVAITGGSISGISIGITAAALQKTDTFDAIGDVTGFAGTPLYVKQDVVLDYTNGFAGPSAATGYGSSWDDFPAGNGGPRGVITLEGTTEYWQNAGIAGGPVLFQAFNVIKNKAGVSRTIGGGALFNLSPQFLADGATATLSAGFALPAPDLPTEFVPEAVFVGGFCDNPWFGPANGGHLDFDPGWSAGFWTLPAIYGNAQLDTRTDFYAREIYRADDGVTTPTVNKHVGLYLEPFNAAESNIGIVTHSPIDFHPTAITHSRSPWRSAGFGITGGAAIALGGTQTLDFANATFGAFLQSSGTVQLKQSGLAGSLWSMVSQVGNFQNHSSVAANLSTVYGNYLHPTFRANAQTITAETNYSVHTAPTYSVLAGGTLTATGHTGVLVGAAVNTGATLTTFKGLNVQNPTGTGTVTNVYGIHIEPLSKGTTENVGILSESRVYIEDGTASHGRISLGTTGGPIENISLYSDSGHANPVATIVGLSGTSSFEMGPGGAGATDVKWARTGAAAASFTGAHTFANALTVTGTFTANGATVLNGTVSAQDTTAPQVTATNGTATDGLVKLSVKNIGVPLGTCEVLANSGDANAVVALFNVNGTGQVVFGPGGGSATDFTIQRTGANAVQFGGSGKSIGFYGATPVAQRANANQAAAPAGGTGATAGAYDTAAHRDALIALVNEMRTVLVNLGLMKGSA